MHAGVSAPYMGKNPLTPSDFTYFPSSYDIPDLCKKLGHLKFLSGSEFCVDKFMS